MAVAKTPKKRNAQDATRTYDIRPLRKRVAVLEGKVKALTVQLKGLIKAVDASGVI